MSDAALALRRKLGSNPGKEVSAGVSARLAARLSGGSSSRATSRSRLPRSSSSSPSSTPSYSSPTIRIRLTSQENGSTSCSAYNLSTLHAFYRGTLECTIVDGTAAIINELSLEDYMLGLAEEPDTEPYEKQRAFAIAARTYATWYLDDAHRKFPGKPYDGADSPATFQKYSGVVFEDHHPHWVEAVRDTAGEVLTFDGEVIKPPYFSSDDGRTRSPQEAGWSNFPFADIFASKEDPWCAGQALRGHGVGMSGCGAEAQALEGKTGEEILGYYYPGTAISTQPVRTAQSSQ
jgi:peptidoglycan hydrolase-like amidase